MRFDLRHILLLLCSAAVALSQTVNGTLLGTVTDSSGGAIPNAQIQVKEMNTGITREGRTGEAGTYVFANLPQGRYAVSVEVQGFKKGVRENVDVLVNTTVRIDMTLQPGAITEVINVTAETPLLQTDRSDTGRKIEEAQLANLPVSTQGARNFQVLMNFGPGATRVTPLMRWKAASVHQKHPPANTAVALVCPSCGFKSIFALGKSAAPYDKRAHAKLAKLRRSMGVTRQTARNERDMM